MKSLILLIFLTSNTAWYQSLESFLKDNAVEVDLGDTIYNEKLVNVLKGYKVIMMGEMHGSQEPAKFVDYVTDQFLKSGYEIQLGLEIPQGMLSLFIQESTIENLRKTDFFGKGYADGRASENWFNLIAKYYQHPQVKLFYFDQEYNDNSDKHRGSVMYENIKNHIRDNSNSVVITISGNVHNRLIPFKSMKTAAYYLSADESLNITDKILSINHQYKYGTMRNNMGAGLQLHTIEPVKSYFSEATSYEAYFSILPKSFEYPYNAIFYTEKITAAEIINAGKE